MNIQVANINRNAAALALLECTFPFGHLTCDIYCPDKGDAVVTFRHSDLELVFEVFGVGMSDRWRYELNHCGLNDLVTTRCGVRLVIRNSAPAPKPEGPIRSWVPQPQDSPFILPSENINQNQLRLNLTPPPQPS